MSDIKDNFYSKTLVNMFNKKISQLSNTDCAFLFNICNNLKRIYNSDLMYASIVVSNNGHWIRFKTYKPLDIGHC